MTIAPSTKKQVTFFSRKTYPLLDANRQDRVPGSVRDSCAGARDRLGKNYGNRSRIRLTPSNQPVLGGSIY